MEVNPPQPELFIGIDQSYSGFGLVALRKTGTKDTILWKFPSLGSDGERLLLIRNTLLEYFRSITGKDSVLAIEGYAHGSKFNREKLGELGGVVKMAWYEYSGTDPEIVPPTVLKKFVTGKGTASKDLMLTSVQERWNAGITNHNVADAYGLAQLLKESYT